MRVPFSIGQPTTDLPPLPFDPTTYRHPTHPFLCRPDHRHCLCPDMTFAVDWALSNNYLSIYPFLPILTPPHTPLSTYINPTPHTPFIPIYPALLPTNSTLPTYSTLIIIIIISIIIIIIIIGLIVFYFIILVDTVQLQAALLRRKPGGN